MKELADFGLTLAADGMSLVGLWQLMCKVAVALEGCGIGSGLLWGAAEAN